MFASIEVGSHRGRQQQRQQLEEEEEEAEFGRWWCVGVVVVAVDVLC